MKDVHWHIKCALDANVNASQVERVEVHKIFIVVLTTVHMRRMNITSMWSSYASRRRTKKKEKEKRAEIDWLAITQGNAHAWNNFFYYAAFFFFISILFLFFFYSRNSLFDVRSGSMCERSAQCWTYKYHSFLHSLTRSRLMWNVWKFHNNRTMSGAVWCLQCFPKSTHMWCEYELSVSEENAPKHTASDMHQIFFSFFEVEVRRQQVCVFFFNSFYI